ncbi:DUF4192 domain-containing protein [Streptomyces sp. NPDC000410]|uniref:DUF4192 domain-containing protein n=1 Tax=Streptomyces sp. NPDC000410 TaxID=3154254 RepID=UPI00332B3C2C
MNKHQEPTGPADEQLQITLRGPAELADALPYMLGFRPTDSVVLVALHGTRGRFGGRLRLGIPEASLEWLPMARQLAESLVESSEGHGARPDGVIAFLCQDPKEGETGHDVMERLRPLAQWLRTACGALDVPVYEALCISDRRFWSYCCPDPRCCPAEGTAMAMPGTSVMAAAAAYAGIQVRGSLREMEDRLKPVPAPAAAEQQRALDTAGAALVTRMVAANDRDQVAAETVRLARRLMKRLGEKATLGVGWTEADAGDDKLISHDEAAAVIIGLQDRDTRDTVAGWMEGAEADRALRLWRALSRRCVAPYVEHAAAPLALAGWVSWSTGDEPGARVALSLALRVDPEYVFARLLHQACNEGLDPEALRCILRSERTASSLPGSGVSAGDHGPDAGSGDAGPGDGSSSRTAGRRTRARTGTPRSTGPKKGPSAGTGAPAADQARRRRSTPRPDTAAARSQERSVGRGGPRDTRSGR